MAGSEIVKKYREYRKSGMNLNSKIVKSLDKELLISAGKLLGVYKKGVFAFKDVDESSVLMDFAMNDCRRHGKSAVETYREKKGPENEIEDDILNALVNSYSSLFKVTSTDTENNLVNLHDVFNENSQSIVDVGLSNSLKPGLLIFFRLVCYEDFNMTSGVAFIFPENSEEYIIEDYERLFKRIKSDNVNVRRYVSFFKINDYHGLDLLMV